MFLLGLALVVAAGALGFRFRGAFRGVPEVRIGSARLISPNRADAILTANGYLISRTQAAIGAKVSGRVEEIRVEEGDQVDAGQIIAVLEHADLKAGLLAAGAAHSRARADVRAAEIVLTEDERDLQRKKALFEASIGPREDWEKAGAKRDGSKARLEAMRQQAALDAARVKESQEILENMFIRAPFSGTVISKDAEIGETITPGGMGAASGRGSVVTLADLAHIEVETDVKEDYIGRIRLGQPARVEVDAVPGRIYRGRLRKIIPMGDRSRAIIQVKVEILDADARLFPEMSATVHFLPDETTPADLEDRPRVYVPASALWEKEGGQAIWVVREGRVSARMVLTGGRRGDLVEIREGLDGGEQVILDPPPGLTEGARVQAAKP